VGRTSPFLAAALALGLGENGQEEEGNPQTQSHTEAEAAAAGCASFCPAHVLWILRFTGIFPSQVM
jgi:hypothetical protein